MALFTLLLKCAVRSLDIFLKSLLSMQVENRPLSPLSMITEYDLQGEKGGDNRAKKRVI